MIPRPRRGLLYGLTFLVLATLAAVEVLVSPGASRTVLRCGLALGAFAAMALWVRLNRAALDLQGWCDCAREKTTVRVIPSRRPELPAVAPTGPAIPARVRHGGIEEEAQVWAAASVRR